MKPWVGFALATLPACANSGQARPNAHLKKTRLRGGSGDSGESRFHAWER